ncbi:DUF5714 domain-containing protein [Myxococcota bacterium]
MGTLTIKQFEALEAEKVFPKLVAETPGNDDKPVVAKGIFPDGPEKPSDKAQRLTQVPASQLEATEDPYEVIEIVCAQTKETNPYEIANQVMHHPTCALYHPYHHSLVPAAVLTALKNGGHKKPDGEPITYEDIQVAIDRGRKVCGGSCGNCGACGAAIGTGIAASVITGATPQKAREREIAHRATIGALEKVNDGLNYCCKRSTMLSIGSTLEFFKDELEFKPTRCEFIRESMKLAKSKETKLCEGKKCPICNCAPKPKPEKVEEPSKIAQLAVKQGENKPEKDDGDCAS